MVLAPRGSWCLIRKTQRGRRGRRHHLLSRLPRAWKDLYYHSEVMTRRFVHHSASLRWWCVSSFRVWVLCCTALLLTTSGLCAISLQVDPALLQFQNQKLSQQLEVHKERIHELETAVEDSRAKQSNYDETLLVVNSAWNQVGCYYLSLLCFFVSVFCSIL